MAFFNQEEYRVLVTGGRHYPDKHMVFRSLDYFVDYHPNIIIIHGATCDKSRPLVLSGVDKWAHDWALANEYPVIAVPAKQRQVGHTAGLERNEYMLVRFMPHIVVAFPGIVGTPHMEKIAHEAGLPVWEPVKEQFPPRRATAYD